jgi:ribosomal protein S27AE
MGRTYLFECPKCGYSAKVSGQEDRGFTLCIQTIVCRDCKKLYDAVIRIKVSEAGSSGLRLPASKFKTKNLLPLNGSHESPPPFQIALNRLAFPGQTMFKWKEFKLRCPVSQFHQVEPCAEVEKCPRCGTFLERHALPFRIWD